MLINSYAYSTVTLPVDPNFSNVILLLHADEANGATTTIDSSSRGITLPRSGNSQISTAKSKFGTASMLFDATGAFTADSNAVLAFGTGDFTIELQIWPDTTQSGSPYLLDWRPSGTNGFYPGFYLAGSSITFITDAGSFLISTSNQVTFSAWNHIAITRSGTTLRIFINGVQGATATSSHNFLVGAGGRPTVGSDGWGAGYHFRGNIDEVRITKGVARYTSNFTPPTQPFPSTGSFDFNFGNVSLLLHGEGANGATTTTDSSSYATTMIRVGTSPTISTTQKKFGSSSMLFLGSPNGGGWTANGESRFAFGTGDFTIELWAYIDSGAGGVSNSPNLIDYRPLGGNGAYPTLSVEIGLIVRYSTLASSKVIASAGSAVTMDSWNHYAVCRASGTTRLFVNGVSVGSMADTTDYAVTTGRPIIGTDGYNSGGTGYAFPGWIDDLRITKGFARYTGNFTPPTVAFPDIGPDPSLNNVSLLLHFDGAEGSGTIVDSSPRVKTITRTGLTPRVLTTTQKKFGSASLNATLGNGPLTVPVGTDFNFGSGNWTVEGWVYFTTFGLNATFITIGGDASGFFGPLQIQFVNNSFLRCYISSNGTSWDVVSGLGMNLDTSAGLNTWHHWQVTRSGSNIHMGSRGVVDNTVVFAGSLPAPAGNPIVISGNYPDDPSGGWGYLDEIRITKGVARYPNAGTYIVPSTEFPNL